MSKPVRTDPADKLGVYKSVDKIPTRNKLSFHEPSFEGRDVWTEYMGSVGSSWSKTTITRYERTGRYWKGFMADRGRHHACAEPSDVEQFLKEQEGRMATKSLYGERFVPLEDFYEWMARSVEFPHVYNPVLMACTSDGITRSMWNYRLEITDREPVENDYE